MNGFNLSDWALRHRAFVLYLMIVTTIFGALSYMRLGRDEDPAFTIKTMLVMAQWPGATTEETVDEVTDRIEKTLQQTPSLDFIRSYTKPGEAVIYVNLKDTVRSKDVPDIWYQVRKKVDDMRHTLPSGVVGPFFNDEFGDTYAVIYAFTADGFSDRELRDTVEAARTQLMNVPDVAKVDLIGTQDEVVYIEFSPARVAGLNIDYETAVATLQQQNAVVPAGTIEAEGEKVFIRISGGLTSEASIEALNLRINDRFVKLGSIANVRRAYTDPPSPQFRYNGEPAIGLAVSMRKGGNVTELGEHVAEAMRDFIAELPIGIEAHLVANQPHVVEEAVGGFTQALFEAVAIVLAVSFLSLGLRAGLVVAFSIPLVLAATFIAMEILGIDLQRISLGALIIALGLLVDDAMITVEMMISKLEEGIDRIGAATFAYTATAFPMLTGTLVTAAGFVPIGFARSSAGEYTFSLFQVIVIALLISWIVAVVFSPYLGVLLLKEKRSEHAHHATEGRWTKAFRLLLVRCLHRRKSVVAGTLIAFALSIAGLGLVEQQFFPSSDRPELLVNLTLPQMTTVAATKKTVDELEAVLAADEEVESWSSYVGQGAVRFYLPMDVQLRNDNFAQLVVVTKGFRERDRVRERLERVLAESFDHIVVRVSALEQGPPTGWPIKYRVSADDIGEAQDAAARLAAIVAESRYARNVNLDWNEMAKVVRVKIDSDRARLVGLSAQMIAERLNTAFSGDTITELRDDVYLVDVTVRAGDADRNTIETTRNLQMPAAGGQSVSLGQFATIDYGLEWPIVWRRDRQPTVTVQADVADGVQAATLVADIAGAVDGLRAELSPSVAIEAGGTVEDSAKSQASVFAVAPVMFLIMATILMIQLQSFGRLFLVASVAPLGIIGVTATMFLSRTPLGFVALLGVIALTGMIIRNSVILVMQIDTYVKGGTPAWVAIVEASVHRLRPILLTAAAAILAMIPIAVEVFWGPMAYAIMGGLAVGTVLTLLFLPALFALWYRIEAP